jgi:hypothetical protein
MEGMNESYCHSSFFIATARRDKDFQLSQTLKLTWVLSSCMFSHEIPTNNSNRYLVDKILIPVVRNKKKQFIKLGVSVKGCD